MDKINLNEIFNRSEIYNNIKKIILNFDNIKNIPGEKKAIYIYGEPGCGKSFFISSLLKDIDYDYILYDTGEIRNKNIIETINQYNLSNVNVLSSFNKKKQSIAIIMDEIDGMNTGDKGGINSLIKLIRPKKTTKQKKEETNHLPIICIGNYIIDKKIKELMKVCYTFELLSPTYDEINNVILNLFKINDKLLINNLNNFIQNDLRKLNLIYKIYCKDKSFIINNNITNILCKKQYDQHTKDITYNLILNNYNIDDHINLINETDRTTISLLWHENIIDFLNNNSIIYLKILENICYGDYIDRITFQKQIWQFNEMSSLIKIFNNNYIIHNSNCNLKNIKNNIRFTKILTKYSNEYNNSIFILNLCQNLNIDKKDVLSFFYEKFLFNDINDIYLELEKYDINKLDINRIFKYINRIYNNLND